MAGGVTVEVQGARELAASLGRASQEVGNLSDANAQAGSTLAAAASARAPRVSGTLAGSIRATTEAGAAVVSAGGPSVPYAGPIHWGWPRRNIRAQPFLTDAAAATMPTTVDTYQKAVARVVDGIHGK